LGNETVMRERAREVWLPLGIDGALNDLRYGWRGLRRSPVFTSVATLTLALVIGANTAIFSVVHRLLLAPLPYEDGTRIVRLDAVPFDDPRLRYNVPRALRLQWEAQAHGLEEFAAASLGGAGEDSLTSASITTSFLPMLRVAPVLGRGFTDDDLHPSASRVAMLSHALWQLRYAAARDVLGKVIRVNGQPRTIVGVAPSHLSLPLLDDERVDVWLPLNRDSAAAVSALYARLRHGITSKTAARELNAILRQLPDTGGFKGAHARALSAPDMLDAGERRGIAILFLAVGGLLLIACANIANLLLMRTWTRQRELAIRQALGAGRLRLARQLLIESLTLASLGGGLGIIVGWQALHAIVAFRPGFLTADLETVRIDTSVLTWSIVASLVTGLLFGIGPALLSGTRAMTDALRAGVRSAGNRGARHVRSTLIVTEIALSLMFLIAAALLVRSFAALARTPIGYDPHQLVAVQVRLAHLPPRSDWDAVHRALVNALGSVPGTTQLALGGLPQTNVRMGPFSIEGPSGPQPLDLQLSEMPFVEPEYFRVARIPLVRGRTFSGADDRELIVNQRFARQLWPSGNAVGAKLRVGSGTDATWLTVVGIAGDLTLPGGEDVFFKQQMYRPPNAAPDFVRTVLMRVESPGAAGLDSAFKRAIESAVPSATLESVMSADRVFDSRVLARPRFALVVFGVFAMMAVALAAVGLYGVIAYAVTQRTREIGVRVALGADPRAVMRLVLTDSARLVLLGGVLGLVGAYAVTRGLATFLYQLSPTDPLAFGGAVLVLVTVALSASLVPVRRAIRVDPVDALRAD
jgi:putative ABC transport system permease protein